MKFSRALAVITAVALVLLAAGLVLARRFHLSTTMQILMALGVALAWVICFLLVRLSAPKKKPAPKAETAASAGLDPQVEKQILQTIDRLRRTSHKSGGREGALYGLPWFMVIGAKSSGKTTLLQRSGVRFPYVSGDTDPREVARKGAGGTHNVDWFISDQAVFLDTSGEYLEQAHAEEWPAFLDLLRRHVPERPFQGLLVTVSMADLFGPNAEAPEALAERLRWHIDQLTERLPFSPPVYVLFTKCDLVHGFLEFFAELSQPERATVWGATIRREAASSRPARHRALFEEEMGALLASLRRAQPLRLARVEGHAARPAVVFFPSQFEAACARLARFVELLFRDTHHETPLLRGCYFTSSGAPAEHRLDPFFDQWMPRVGLAPFPAPDAEAAPAGSYFVEDLFAKVVLPDRNLSGTSMAEARRRRARFGRVALVCGAVAGVLLAWWSIAYLHNRTALTHLEKRTRAVLAATAAGGEHFGPNDLLLFEDLRAQVHNLEGREHVVSRILNLGTYGGAPAVTVARQAYLGAFDRSVLGPAFHSLCAELQTGAEPADGGFRRYYRSFSTWQALRNLGPHQAPQEVDLLAECLSRYWASDRWKLAGDVHSKAASDLRRQLDYAGGFAHPMPDPCPEGLEQRVQMTMARFWTPDGMYASFEKEAGGNLPDATVEALLQNTNLWLHGAPGTGVPGVYTHAAVDSAGPVRAYLQWLDSVRGERPSLTADLLSRYRTHYRDRWLSFLAGVRCSVPRGEEKNFLGMAASKVDSPVLKLVQAVDRHTTFAAGSDMADIGPAFQAIHAVATAKAEEYAQAVGAVAANTPPLQPDVDRVETTLRNWERLYAISPDVAAVGPILRFPVRVASGVAVAAPAATTATPAPVAMQSPGATESTTPPPPPVRKPPPAIAPSSTTPPPSSGDGFERKKWFSVSVVPSNTSVVMDGRPLPKIKDLGRDCVLLAEGTHTFALQRQDGSTATLHYTVKADDKANILVLEFRNQKVQTDTDPGVQCPEE